MKKDILFLLIISSVIIISGCASQGTLKLYAIDGGGGISSISIDYSWAGWGSKSYTLEIKKVGDDYFANDAKIDTNKIDRLSKSLVNLKLSGGLKSCTSHTDDYPSYRIEITFASGENAILYSDSNCVGNNPWNIAYKDKLYAQYSYEIPKALFDILQDAKVENVKPLGSYFYGGEYFDIIGRELPIELTNVTFSEERYYSDIVKESNLFSKSDNVKIKSLMCELTEKNRYCNNVLGIISLSRKNNRTLILPLNFSFNKVQGIQNLKKINQWAEKLENNKLVQKLMRFSTPQISYSCAFVTPGQISDFKTVYAIFGKNVTPELDVSTFQSITDTFKCPILTLNLKYIDATLNFAKFIYFPSLDVIWAVEIPSGEYYYDPILGKFVKEPVDYYALFKDLLGAENVVKKLKEDGLVSGEVTDIQINGACQIYIRIGENGVFTDKYCIFVNEEGYLYALNKIT